MSSQPYVEGPSEEWVMGRIVWDRPDDMTAEQAVARERERYEQTVAEMETEGLEISQSWHEVVEIMRQSAREIADNAQSWWVALDEEENRLAARGSG